MCAECGKGIPPDRLGVTCSDACRDAFVGRLQRLTKRNLELVRAVGSASRKESDA